MAKGPEGMDPMTKYCYKQTFEDNLVEATDSSKFETCEEVFNKYPDLSRYEKEQYCKQLRFSYKMYEEYPKLKFGFNF